MDENNVTHAGTVRHLVAMGFQPEQRVQLALEAAGYKEEMAIDLLLSDASQQPLSLPKPRMGAHATNPYNKNPSKVYPVNTTTATATVAATALPQQHQQQQQQKRTWGAPPTTLRTMGPQYQYDNNNNNKTPLAMKDLFCIQHIPTLSQADTAKAILERIKVEFEPIIRRRGYCVRSITEMCCCSDGLEHMSDAPPTTTTNSKYRKRKTKSTRRMPDNVLGYNLTSGYRRQLAPRPTATTQEASPLSSSSHEIHLRLRHPPSSGSWNHHILYDYNDIAGTMCHELAHCIYGNHDQHFYKLMDEIMEEYSLLLVRGIPTNTTTTAAVTVHGSVENTSQHTMDKMNHWSGPGYTLGGGRGRDASGTIPTSYGIGGIQRETKTKKTKNDDVTTTTTSTSNVPSSKRHVLAQAALDRWQNHTTTPHSYHDDGDDNNNNNDNLKPTLQNLLTPREAAAIAAENRWIERQRIDSQFCLPCKDIIEILDDDYDDAEEEEVKEQSIGSLIPSSLSLGISHSKDGNEIIEILD